MRRGGCGWHVEASKVRRNQPHEQLWEDTQTGECEEARVKKKKKGVSEEQKSISWNKVSKETMGRNAVGKGRQCPALYVLMGPGGLRQD